MKRPFAILTLVLVVALSGVLVGCQTAQPAATTAPTKAPTSAPAPTTAPTSAPAATVAPTATTAPTPVPVVGPKSGGTVRIIVQQLPPIFGGAMRLKGFNPTFQAYFFGVVETLIGLTKEGPAPTKLATYWEITPDGKAITFKLRQGVKFHDGTDFNAEAVKWNVEKIQSHRSEVKSITSIDVLDTYTVRFNLSEFSNSLLYQLAWYAGAMVSPASLEGRDEDYMNTHLIGTGPFELVSFQKDTNAVFKKFAGYWDEGKPYLDGMEYVVVKDYNTARSALLSGQAEVWDYVTPKYIPDLKTQGYNVNTCPGVSRVGFGDSVNAESPFSKKEVRWAIEYAVDKQAIADTFGAGTWEVPLGPCSASQMGCTAITPDISRSYDPAKAKQLLADAGYPNGFKTEILSVASIDQELLVAIQGYLRGVGIDAEIKVLDSAKMTAVRTQGWTNGIVVQGVGVANASYVQSLETDGPSPSKAFSALVSPEYSAALTAARIAIDSADQKAKAEQLVKLVYDEAIFVPWAIESRNCAYPKNIHIDLDSFSLWFWNPGDTWIDQ